MALSELERRVLGHLPAWAEDEEAHVAAEGGPRRIDPETGEWTGSIRSYTVLELTWRLSEDPNAVGQDTTGAVRHLLAAEVNAQLLALERRGLSAVDSAEPTAMPAGWRMTEAGHAELTGPANLADQIPGPVEVELNPAVHVSGAQG